MRNRKYKR
jgi:hypothetical protein